jgi:hypothetical protein
MLFNRGIDTVKMTPLSNHKPVILNNYIRILALINLFSKYLYQALRLSGHIHIDFFLCFYHFPIGFWICDQSCLCLWILNLWPKLPVSLDFESVTKVACVSGFWMCDQCCLCLWILNLWPKLPVSLDFESMTNVACVSGFSILVCMYINWLSIDIQM